jgi:hypothetical protein
MIKTRYLLVFISLFCSKAVFAQSGPPAWGGGADLEDFSFGFSFQYVNGYYKIEKKPGWRAPYFDAETNKNLTDSVNTISSKNSPGFAIGFIARYSITDHLEVRTTPALVFSDRNLSYTYKTPSQDIDKTVAANMIDLPLLLKLKSDRIGNMRAYIMGGVKYSQAIGSQKKDPTDDPLAKLVKNVSGFGSYEAGLGLDIYFEFFKLSPEIRFSNSFGNILVPETHPFSAPINKLSLHNVMFSLYFE